MLAILTLTARYVFLYPLILTHISLELHLYQVKGYTADQLDEALEGAKVIVIPAGVPRKVWFKSGANVRCH
jgi:hypothetical protein